MLHIIYILIPILLPFVSGLLSLCFKESFSDEEPAILGGWVSVTLVLELAAVIAAALAGVGVIPTGGLALSDPYALYWDITGELTLLFKVDSLSILFSCLTAVIWLLAGIFSFGYMEHEKHRGQYYRFYLLIEGAIMALAYAGNYLTLYMAFELMTILSFPLVMHSRTKESIVAAQKYLFYSIFGACLGLVGYFYLGAWLDSTVFTAGGTYGAAAAGHESGLLIVVMLVLVGFGAKAGMFPMHAWLPAAHPVAPAPASAVMSGIITKCGVIAVIRVVFYLVGAEHIRGTWVQTVWMILALVTVFMGSMLAYMEDGFKKRLAYSSVSQVSYVLFGLSTLTTLGAVGALLHVVFHSVIKDLLFLCSGAVIHKAGITRVRDLKGIGKRMPMTMWCFTIAALGLVGIPPACGFFSKWYLALGSLQDGMGALSIIGPVILLVSALLTAGYLFTISMKAFLPGTDFNYEKLTKCDPGAAMLVPMVLLAIAVFALGICVKPLAEQLTALAAAWM